MVIEINIDYILKCFPIHIRDILNKNLTNEELELLEEIRVRNNLPLICKIGQADKVLNYKISTEDINYIFQKICENSIYTYQNQIANGYITIQGGNRVGIVGTAVLHEDKVTNFNYISGLNFRISRQILGCSNSIMQKIINKEQNTIYNTLIISMPGMGKTTLLRDIIRNISNGIEGLIDGANIAVIDERGEISATFKGIMQNDLGIRTDVVNDIPKHIGMRLAIRSMSPKVLAADEIGSKEDSEAIKYAMCCGVKGIFTAHGESIEDVCKNPELKELINNKTIERVVLIKNSEFEDSKKNHCSFNIIKIN